MHSQTPASDYTSYTPAYNKDFVQFWEDFPREFLEAFATRLTSNRVLCVGSESGRDALLLRDLGLDVVCLDAAQNMVDMTTKLGFESYLATYHTLEKLEGHFDGVWAYASLIHVTKEDARSAALTLHDFLKPGGIFAIGVVEGQGSENVPGPTMADPTVFFQYYSSSELKDMIEELGFSFAFEDTYKVEDKTYINQLYVLQ